MPTCRMPTCLVPSSRPRVLSQVLCPHPAHPRALARERIAERRALRKLSLAAWRLVRVARATRATTKNHLALICSRERICGRHEVGGGTPGARTRQLRAWTSQRVCALVTCRGLAAKPLLAALGATGVKFFIVGGLYSVTESLEYRS